jgi:hypothetical protein
MMFKPTKKRHLPPAKPSWQRWPPNCCEICIGWEQDKNDRWIGTCHDSTSLNANTPTDARYRCPAFKRKAGV